MRDLGFREGTLGIGALLVRLGEGNTLGGLWHFCHGVLPQNPDSNLLAFGKRSVRAATDLPSAATWGFARLPFNAWKTALAASGCRDKPATGWPIWRSAWV